MRALFVYRKVERIMICPYMTNTVWSFVSNPVYDEDGRVDYEKQYSTTTELPHECERENCAAWQNGRCVRTA